MQSTRKPSCRIYPDKGGRGIQNAKHLSEEGFIATFVVTATPVVFYIGRAGGAGQRGTDQHRNHA